MLILVANSLRKFSGLHYTACSVWQRLPAPSTSERSTGVSDLFTTGAARQGEDVTAMQTLHTKGHIIKSLRYIIEWEEIRISL